MPVGWIPENITRLAAPSEAALWMLAICRDANVSKLPINVECRGEFGVYCNKSERLKGSAITC